ncbi:hypothetical protein ACLVWU_08675 [Bdellovibrio sp. HCB290]|uniref:hypothetical protein n=1 Tax=Bdellovibrio sp. HCB290 TaxID=3394356 RepID=UPI0039B463A9
MSKENVKRIVSINKDLSEVKKIYLHAGLVSTVEFQDAITSVKIGNGSSFKVEISPSNPKEVTLRLVSQRSEPTNLLVRVEKKVFIFDLIPSRNTHQDYVKVSGSYGRPEHELSRVTKQNRETGKLVETIIIGGD